MGKAGFGGLTLRVARFVSAARPWAVIALLAAAFLNQTIFGRYLLALGRNETAARYSGINTDRMKMLAYVICSLLAGVGGILFSLDLNSIQPSGLGEFYELYAIAAAVFIAPIRVARPRRERDRPPAASARSSALSSARRPRPCAARSPSGSR